MGKNFNGGIKMNYKNLISKNKRIVICLIVALVIGILCGSSQMPKQDYKKLLAQKNNKIVRLYY